MRPPFLKLGGEDNFADYQTEFHRLLPSGLIDFLGNQVNFPPGSCHHICYKQSDVRSSSSPRDQWRQDRAERIPWIKVALQKPTFICEGSRPMWVYLVEIEQDRGNNLVPELFCVVVDARDVEPETPGTVYFVTGYTISFREWNDKKKNGRWIHPPPKPYKPGKIKKKKT
ncbi:MAG: hypothetical protein JWL77_6376 [Chthonomonadaceae bacterium]|jgi:hypothetical protein|nr:hypothetical protein [Chthonomonadaceae bacterium]